MFGVMAATDKLDGYLARQTQPDLQDRHPARSPCRQAAGRLLGHPAFLRMGCLAGVSNPDCRCGGDLCRLRVGCRRHPCAAGHGRAGQDRARPLGKLNTVFQLALVMLTLIAPALPPSNDHWILAALNILWRTVPAIAVLTVADYTWLGIARIPSCQAIIRHALFTHR